MAEYKWDLVDLNSYISNLAGMEQDLKDAVRYINDAKEIVVRTWEGNAAKQFHANIDSDIENVNLLLKMVTEQKDALSKAKTEGYEQCQNSIKSELSKLQGNIK